MITPGVPAPMWAIHDTRLDTYSPPFATHLEARLMRNREIGALHATDRARLFPVVPVNITITPRPHNAGEIARQPTLFPTNGGRHAHDART